MAESGFICFFAFKANYIMHTKIWRMGNDRYEVALVEFDRSIALTQAAFYLKLLAHVGLGIAEGCSVQNWTTTKEGLARACVEGSRDELVFYDTGNHWIRSLIALCSRQTPLDEIIENSMLLLL